MPAPLSMDLRERIVRAYEAKEGSAAYLAERFDVSQPTVERWLRRHRRTGSVAPSAMGGARNSKFDAHSEQRLREMVAEQPDVLVRELVERLGRELELRVSDSAVRRALHRLGLTRKKRRSTPPSATVSV